jgi:hypothetical protein
VSRRQADNTRVHQYLWTSCIVCLSSTHRYWWTLVLSVRLLLTDIDELLYCLSVFYSQILMNSCIVCLRQYKSSSISVSRRQTDNTRVHQYLWVEAGQTIQEFIVLSVRLLLTDIDELLYCLSVFYSRILMNSCIVCLSSTHIYWWTLVLFVCLLLTDIDYLLYCLSVFYSQILMNSCIVCLSSSQGYWWTFVRQTDNTRVHQYLWVEDRQTIQEFINICK